MRKIDERKSGCRANTGAVCRKIVCGGTGMAGEAFDVATELRILLSN